MNERDQWREFDIAESTLLDLVGCYVNLQNEEERKANPDPQLVAKWERERKAIVALKRTLDVSDHAGVAHINQTYGPVLRAFMNQHS